MRLAWLLFFIPLVAFGQKYDLKSQPKVRVTKPPKAVKVRKLAPIPETQAPPKSAIALAGTVAPEFRWGGEVAYILRTDLADQISPRLYLHALSLAYGVENTVDNWAITGILDAAYESTGERRSEILVDDDRKELFLNDFTLAFDKTYKAVWDSKVMLGVANAFPTTPEAVREDYNSVTSASVGWNIPVIPKRLSTGLVTEVYYIWNRYEYSPATGDLNKQGGGRAELSGRLNLYKGWYVSAMGGAQISRFLDGTNDMTYRNAIGTGYNWSRFSAAITLSNGTYMDREDSGVWFVDEYRRMLSFSMRLSF